MSAKSLEIMVWTNSRSAKLASVDLLTKLHDPLEPLGLNAGLRGFRRWKAIHKLIVKINVKKMESYP